MIQNKSISRFGGKRKNHTGNWWIESLRSLREARTRLAVDLRLNNVQDHINHEQEYRARTKYIITRDRIVKYQVDGNGDPRNDQQCQQFHQPRGKIGQQPEDIADTSIELYLFFAF